MADDGPSEALPPPPRPPWGWGRKVVVASILVAVAVSGAFFARTIYRALLQPAPEFRSLATTPDPSLVGTVAFLEPGDGRCVYVVAASGGEPEELACGERLAGELAWRGDGRLQSTSHPSADGDEDPISWIIDPATGEVDEVPADEIPPDAAGRAEQTGPNGERVTCEHGGGELTLTLTTDDGTRTLLSTAAPSTYCLHFPVWSEDGTWFIVEDDLDRLLLVTTGDPSTTRVLVDGGYWPAVTDVDLLGR